jgi:hypothetical protein
MLRWLVAARAAALRSRPATLAAKLRSRRILHCLGDSHVVVFNELVKHRRMRRTWLDSLMIRGATAFGMANPNSRTNAFAEFTGMIHRLPRSRPLLFMLGEVDCGFLIWYRARSADVPVEEQLELSVRNYLRFLDGLRAEGRTLMVAAVPLPTIRDGQVFGEVANARKDVTASLAERTALTVRYNAALRSWCRASGCVFLDYEAEMLDPATGLIREDLRHPDPLNHHANPERFGELMARHLRDAGFP